MTKIDAMNCRRGQTLYHVNQKDSQGNPTKVRVNGACKTWKGNPLAFKLPVKYGLYNCFDITSANAHQWTMTKESVAVCC